MSGDWIKIRADLFTHPKVVRISSALKADTLRTVGGLTSVWCLFDAHSEDGRLSGYTSETLDDHLRWPGFAAAMQAVSWLYVVEGEGLELPRFDAHNGNSAKRRAQDADRKKTVRKMSASEADTMRTREEKRREEKKEDIATEAAPKPKAKKAPKVTCLPEDFVLSDRVIAWAAEHGHAGLAQHFEYFVGCAKAKGYEYADWDAALMNAIRNNWAKLPAQTNGAVYVAGGGRRAL